MVKVVLFSIILAKTRKRYALLSVEPEYKNIFLFPLNRITSLQFLLLARSNSFKMLELLCYVPIQTPTIHWNMGSR